MFIGQQVPIHFGLYSKGHIARVAAEERLNHRRYSALSWVVIHNCSRWRCATIRDCAFLGTTRFVGTTPTELYFGRGEGRRLWVSRQRECNLPWVFGATCLLQRTKNGCRGWRLGRTCRWSSRPIRYSDKRSCLWTSSWLGPFLHPFLTDRAGVRRIYSRFSRCRGGVQAHQGPLGGHVGPSVGQGGPLACRRNVGGQHFIVIHTKRWLISWCCDRTAWRCGRFAIACFVVD